MANKHADLKAKITNAIVEVCRNESFYLKELRVEGTVCLVSDGSSVLITQLTEQLGGNGDEPEEVSLPILDETQRTEECNEETHESHKCPFCVKVYRFKQNLRDHINVHTGKRPHVCKHCGATFTHLSNMCAHVRRKHTNSEETNGDEGVPEADNDDGSPPIKIKKEAPPFVAPAPLNLLQASFQKPSFAMTPFALPFNQLPMANTTEFARTEEGKFQCPYCEKAYNFKHTLKDHLNKHTGLRPHVCKHCGDSFTHLASLCNHIKRRHEEKIPQEFQCELCHDRFMNYQSVKQHYTWRHKNELFPKRFSCNSSPRRTLTGSESKQTSMLDPPTVKIEALEPPTPISMKPEQAEVNMEANDPEMTPLPNISDYFDPVNLETEQGNYSYKCKLCGHLLKARKSLYEHIDSHLGRKPYACSHCGDAFTHKSTLHNHIRYKHTFETKEEKEATFRQLCVTCLRKFRYPSELERHLSTNPGHEAKVLSEDATVNLNQSNVVTLDDIQMVQ